MRAPMTCLAITALCLAAAVPADTTGPHDPLLQIDGATLELAESPSPSSAPDPSTGPLPEGVVALADLKDVYLRCELTALTSALSGDEAMECSIVYEELKRLGFAGDARRLREWSAPLLGLPRLDGANEGA